MKPYIVSWFVIAAIVGHAAPSSVAAARGPSKEEIARRQQALRQVISRIDKEIPVAKNHLAAAERDYQVAKAALASVAAPHRETEARLKEATRLFEELQTEIEDDQPPDSAFYQAKMKYVGARAAYQRLTSQIEESPEYLAAYRAAHEESDVSARAEKLAAARKQFITGNIQLLQTQLLLTSTKARYEQERLAIFKDDADYQSYYAAIQTAKEEEAKANSLLRFAASNRFKASRRRAAARKALASLNTTRAQAQAAIRQLDRMK